MFKKKSTKDLVRPSYGDSVATEEPAEKKPKREKKEKKERRPLKDILRNKAVLGVVCIVIALILAFLVIPLMQRQITTDTISVVVLTQDVAIGDKITEDTVTSKEMVAFNLPETVIYSVDDVIGKYVTVSACAGDVLTSNRLSAAYPGDDPELADLPAGKLAISVSLDTLAQSVSGKLRAGDVISLFAVFSDTDTDVSNYEAVSIPELTYVEVLAVTDADAEDVSDQGANDEEDMGQIATVTLIVNAEQAKAVAGLESTATLHAALAVRGNAERKEAYLNAQEVYFQKDDSESQIQITDDTENEVD